MGDEPFNNPFADLAGKLGALPAGPRAEPPAPPKGPARALVRLERKGRRGKEVTVIEQLDLPPRQLDAWLSELKRKLGCGGARDDRALVLQGDLRERLPALLTARGVRKVSVG